MKNMVVQKSLLDSMALIKGLNKVTANRHLFVTDKFLKSFVKTITSFKISNEPPEPI